MPIASAAEAMVLAVYMPPQAPSPGQMAFSISVSSSRVIRPASKLSTLSQWADCTLGPDLAVAGASTDEVYAAMDWLADRQEAIEKKLLFATDEDMLYYGDVETFDYGVEPVVSVYADAASAIQNLPNAIIESYISARAPRDPRDRMPLEEVNLSPAGYAQVVANDVARMLYWFRGDARSFRLENDFAYIGELNRKERQEAHWKSLNEQIEHLGGVEKAVFGFLPLDLKIESKGEPKGVPAAEKISAAALSTRLEKLLQSPAYTNFVGLDEKRYSFTQPEKNLILSRGKKFFEEFEKEVVKRVCKQFENAPRNLELEATGKLAEDELNAKLERKIAEFARTVIMAQDDSKRLKGKVDKSSVEVVAFKYDRETRMAAAELGLTGPELIERLPATPSVGRTLGSLNLPGGMVKRDTFLEVFRQCIDELGLRGKGGSAKAIAAGPLTPPAMSCTNQSWPRRYCSARPSAENCGAASACGVRVTWVRRPLATSRMNTSPLRTKAARACARSNTGSAPSAIAIACGSTSVSRPSARSTRCRSCTDVPFCLTS